MSIVIPQYLITAVKRKEKKAEKGLFLLAAPKIYSLCRRYAIDDHEAQDYMQEAFIRMFDKIHLFDENKASFSTWFYRLTTNRIIDLKRRKKVFSELPMEEVANDIDEEDFIKCISRENLVGAIDRLPDGYKSVVNLFVFEKWTHRDIAKKLKITESTSRSQFTRAKRLLKEILQESIPNNYERKLA